MWDCHHRVGRVLLVFVGALSPAMAFYVSAVTRVTHADWKCSIDRCVVVADGVLFDDEARRELILLSAFGTKHAIIVVRRKSDGDLNIIYLVGKI